MRTAKPKTLLYEDVVEELYRLIDQQEIKPGEKFPSERELVEKYDISRNVLREAFHVLTERGIIYSKQGKGRFLRKVPDYSQTDKYESVSKNIENYSLLEIYQTRQALETKAMEQLVRFASDEDIAELSLCYEQISQQFHETASTAGEFQLHRLYSQKCGNAFLSQMINITLRTTLDMMSNTFRDVLLNHGTDDSLMAHRSIIDAVKNRDAEAACRAMAAHIQTSIDLLK